MEFAETKKKVSKANKSNTDENAGLKAVLKSGTQKFKY